MVKIFDLGSILLNSNDSQIAQTTVELSDQNRFKRADQNQLVPTDSIVRSDLYSVNRTPTDDPIYWRGNGQGEG